MVLVGFSISDVSIGMLWVSLVVLVIYIGYKKLLKYMSRGSINHESYCEIILSLAKCRFISHRMKLRSAKCQFMT